MAEAAEVKQEEQPAGPQAAVEEAPQEPSEGAAQENAEEAPREGSAETPEEAAAAPKRSSILLPVLTVLLILLGIGEAVFWGYFGFSAYVRSLERERYEQQLRVLEEERASRGTIGGSSYSPNLRVENGTVTWEREHWGYTGSGQPANTSTVPRREDGLRLSRLPVVRIPYTLAEMDEDLPETGAADSGTAPTST